MSMELYEVLSLSSRYLFALLGVLIVLRAFLWLLSERSERHRRVRQLPWSGMVGEFIVVSGDTTLPEGMAISVPWEGTIGSVRSCDVFLPCAHVNRKHLSFSFDPGKGLRVMPFSGCEALVNGTPVHCKSHPEESTLCHGSFLQVGNAVLRLRVLAGLDPQAGFRELPDPLPSQMASSMAPLPAAAPDVKHSFSRNNSSQFPQYIPESGYYLTPQDEVPSVPTAEFIPSPLPVRSSESAEYALTGAAHHQPDSSPEGSGAHPAQVSSRRRRSERWEVDWSE